MTDLAHAIEQSVEIAGRVRARQAALADAVESGEPEAIVRAARALLGMDDEQGRDRAAASERRRTGRC